MPTCNLFHILGPATLNELSPYDLSRATGVFNVSWSDDLKVLEDVFSDISSQI